MPKIKNSLTIKVFLITFVTQILLGAVLCGVLTFASPKSYDTSYSNEITEDFRRLTHELHSVNFADAGPLIDDFIRTNDVGIVVSKPYTGPLPLDLDIVESSSELAFKNTFEIEHLKYSDEFETSLLMADTIEVGFKDGEFYAVSYIYYLPRTNLILPVVIRCLPVFVTAVLVISILSAILYSYLFARPVKKISKVSASMANLDLDARCDSRRTDEIGTLANDLDKMASRLKEAIEELKSQNIALEQEIKTREMFFAAASHELKTPVTVMEGQITGMIDEVGPYKDRDLYLRRTLASVKRMESLINEILMVSKMQSAAGLKSQKTDLTEILKKQLDDLADLFEIRNITVDKDLAPEAFFEGDAELTKIALGAFLSNAVFYSEDGASVSIKLSKSDNIDLSIRNHGAHIDEKDLPHLFEAFYRTDSSRSRRTGGSGLGLHLAGLIIEKQGGSCSLTNDGDDVVARITFPST